MVSATNYVILHQNVFQDEFNGEFKDIFDEFLEYGIQTHISYSDILGLFSDTTAWQ